MPIPKNHNQQNRCFGLHFTLIVSILLTTIASSFPSVAQAQTTSTATPLRFGLLSASTQSTLGELGPTFWKAEGYPVTRQTFATTAALLTALVDGEIDLALVLPVEALTDHYQLSFNALPTDQTRVTQLIQTLGEKEELVWSGIASVEFNYTFWLNQGVRENATDLPELLSQLMAGGGADGIDSMSSTAITFCAPQAQQAQTQNMRATLEEEYGLSYQDEQFVFIDPLRFQTTGQPTFTGTLTATAALTSALTAITITESITASPAISESSAAPTFTESTLMARGVTACDVGFDVAPSLLFNASNFVPLADPDRMTSVNRPMLVYRADIAERINDQLPAFAQALAAIDGATATALFTETLSLPPTDRITPTEWLHQFLWTNAFITPPTLTVGSRLETAQSILGAMAELLLEEDGFFTTDATGSMATTGLIDAVKTGDLDLAVMVAGDFFTATEIRPAKLPTDYRETQTLLAEAANELDLVVSTPASFSLTQVLLVDADLASLGITELSTLAAYMDRFDSPLGICMDGDFFSDPIAGLSALEAHYGFQFQPEKIFLMDDDSLFPAINNGRCQVTVGTITDGRIPAWNLVALADDQQFFPQNYPVFVMKNREKIGHSQVWPTLESVLSRLNAAMMQQMTRRVEIGPDGESFSGDELTPRAAAQEYLLGQGLVQADALETTSAAEFEP